MKLCIALSLTFICFWNCSCQGRSGETGSNKDSTPHATNIVANDLNANTGTPLKDQTNRRNKLGNFRVDAYQDNKLASRCFFHKGQLKKEISYNVESNSEEFVTEYFYTKNGDFERLKIIKGDASVLNEILSQSARDFEVQYKFLESKGIEFPLPDIAADEVRDLSKILAVAENYSDFKTDSQADGNQKVIRFVGFNKNVRFEPSTTTLVAGNNPIHIKDFELTLENNFPTKESLKTDDGELTKTYSYKDGKLIGVVYQFTDLENRTNSLEKRFEYHELNQKP